MSDPTYPDDLLYTKDHEWARVEERDGRKVVTIGITRFAVQHLGDVTQVELPKTGERVAQSAVFGSVESVKAVSDLFAPVSGSVVEVNGALTSSPEFLNENPYERGWMIRVETTSPEDLNALMNADAYRAFVREHAEE